MQIRWTVIASDDLANRVQTIYEENPEAAQRTAEKILLGIDRLVAFPRMGRPGQKPGTRELVIDPYVIVYRVEPGFIELLRVWHGAQDRSR
jgi:toxin ParE1/3/4